MYVCDIYTDVRWLNVHAYKFQKTVRVVPNGHSLLCSFENSPPRKETHRIPLSLFSTALGSQMQMTMLDSLYECWGFEIKFMCSKPSLPAKLCSTHIVVYLFL